MASWGRIRGSVRLLRPVRSEVTDSLLEGEVLLEGDGGLVGRTRVVSSSLHPWVGRSGRRGLR